MYLNVFGRATVARCLTFILISWMWPKLATKDTHLIFQPVFMHACACSSIFNYAHKCLENPVNAKKGQTNTKKFQDWTQHSCCSMLTLEKFWKREEATDIVPSPKVACSLPKPSGLLWESLVCEKLIPKPAPNGTNNLPRHVGCH